MADARKLWTPGKKQDTPAKLTHHAVVKHAKTRSNKRGKRKRRMTR